MGFCLFHALAVVCIASSSSSLLFKSWVLSLPVDAAVAVADFALLVVCLISLELPDLFIV